MLRMTWLMPRSCELMRDEMAWPAGSSLALSMREPELNFAIAFEASAVCSASCRCICSDNVLLLIDSDMWSSDPIRR